MRRADFFLGLGLAVFGLVMFVWIIPNQSAEAEQYGMSPALMPMVCAGGIIIFSLLLFLKNLPGKWAPRGEDVVVGREAILKTGLNAAIALAGLLIMHLAGFLAGGVFIIAACMLAAGRRSFLLIAAFSLCVPVVLLLVLRYGLSVYLP